MQYIKVLATDSTNAHLKKLFRANVKMENTCLETKSQTQGRGQRGSAWLTKSGKNLTFSVLLTNLNIKVDEQFKLSALVSLALVKVLSHKLNKVVLSVKWPNDILAGNQKVCGILIENILEADRIKNSIIGIGLNVNQTNFDGLPKASSLKNQTGETFDLNNLLVDLTETLEKEVYNGLGSPIENVLRNYEKHLFRFQKPSLFEFPGEKQANGIIEGVLPSGRLQIRFPDQVKDFDLKEVKLVY